MAEYLTLTNWIEQFNTTIISKEDFIANYVVKSNSKVLPFEEVIVNKKLTDIDIEVLYFVFVENKKAYLTNFYNKSLKIHEVFKNIKLTLNNSANPRYKNIIRNVYYKELLLETTTDIKNSRPFLEVLYDLFNNNIIDYKLLTPSAIGLYKRKNFSSVLSGYYFRSSILNPVVVYTLSKDYLKGKKIFTPTLGWSSYMYGFFNDPNVEEYVGTDVIPQVCTNTKNIAKKLFPNKKIDIYCCPSELLLQNLNFKEKYENHFDIVFCSPPYYRLELYPSENQSTTMYNTYEEWLEKYWENTIILCNYVLKNGGKMAYIISGYDKVKTLNQDMNAITKKYFKYDTQLSLGNQNVDFTKHKDTNESIYLFTKN